MNNPTKQVGLSGKISNLFSDGSRLEERPVHQLFWGFSWQMSQQNLKQPNPFCTHPDLPLGPPSLQYNGYRVSFPAVKRPGRGVDQPSHLAPRFMEE